MAPTQTDPTTSQESPATTDHDVRLLCHLTAQYDYCGTFNLRMCTRKWCDPPNHQPTITLLPGVLGRLPSELRLMIYDFMMPAQTRVFSTNKKKLGPNFAVPKIAHVCREMRWYARQKYRLIRFDYTPVKSWRVSMGSLEWIGDPSEVMFGFFDPGRDSIKIPLYRISEVRFVEDATVEWDNALQAPTFASGVTQVKQYNPSCKKIIFMLETSGLWEILWRHGWTTRALFRAT
ncbi:hypothetical protein NUW58_g1979 [Xylaria curta]|uniref:Uncharacterized protein n=1 Tax=Xylaria curta TaxID=42375 RepID=A0ACC1PHP9_9PEZI|nr:hypothetical protein NUW58_g1979 [Xylaria curta]